MSEGIHWQSYQMGEVSAHNVVRSWQEYAKTLEQTILDLRDDLATKEVELKSARGKLMVWEAIAEARNKSIQALTTEARACPEQGQHHLVKQAMDEQGRPLWRPQEGTMATNLSLVFVDAFDESLRQSGIKDPEKHRLVIRPKIG